MENYDTEKVPVNDLLQLRGTYDILRHMNTRTLPMLYGYLNELGLLVEQEVRECGDK